MFARCGCAMLVAVAVVLIAAPLVAADDPAGVWIGTTEVPGRGTDQITLTIKKAGDGYEGLMTDSLGVVAKEALRDIGFADGVLSFSFLLAEGDVLTMKLKVTGDKMAGEWVHPGGDVGAIAFERKKE